MTFVDRNVLLDILGNDEAWKPWSLDQLDRAASSGGVATSPIVYAEIAPRFADRDRLDRFVSDAGISVVALSRDHLFAAGAAHRRYRQAGGERKRVLPDFIIGAQAAGLVYPLLTRDPRSYRTYFPDVRLITP